MHLKVPIIIFIEEGGQFDLFYSLGFFSFCIPHFMCKLIAKEFIIVFNAIKVKVDELFNLYRVH